jgi:hypothetical protein
MMLVTHRYNTEFKEKELYFLLSLGAFMAGYRVIFTFFFWDYPTISQDFNHCFSQRWSDFSSRAAENETLGEVI